MIPKVGNFRKLLGKREELIIALILMSDDLGRIYLFQENFGKTT